MIETCSKQISNYNLSSLHSQAFALTTEKNGFYYDPLSVEDMGQSISIYAM